MIIKENMAEQIYKEGYCKVEQKITQFVSTLSPKGNWVCTNCSFKTSKLLKAPKPKFSQNYSYNQLYNQLNHRR